jgi:hypothetical protein
VKGGVFMKRRIKKSTSCFLLILVLTISISVCANAKSVNESDEVGVSQLRFTYINQFVNSFTISQYGYASICSYMEAHGVDQVRITAYLQQYKNGYWQTIKSWTDIEDGNWNTLDVGWYVMSGYLYRCVTYGYVYIDESIVESDSYTSSMIYY